jgi:hypothetical protein
MSTIYRHNLDASLPHRLSECHKSLLSHCRPLLLQKLEPLVEVNRRGRLSWTRRSRRSQNLWIGFKSGEHDGQSMGRTCCCLRWSFTTLVRCVVALSSMSVAPGPMACKVVMISGLTISFLDLAPVSRPGKSWRGVLP